jgi:excinuclease ABC subunit C
MFCYRGNIDEDKHMTDKIKSIITKLPRTPGVYQFLDKHGEILYIGKATSLRDRAGSYFLKNAHVDRPHISPMIEEVADIRFQETDSVLEALILESNLIKNHQPKFNVREKDDKSFGYFVITHEEFPRVLAVFKTQLGKYKSKKIYGPYLSKYQMETAIKIIRKIFPFHSVVQHSERYCLDFQMGRCPGPWAGKISKRDYLKNIRGIEMILQGKKTKLLTDLKGEMKKYAKAKKYEKAAEARNKIYALQHIRDMALISRGVDGDSNPATGVESPMRIEAYDISNIGGDFAVGSMVVFSGSKTDKSQYRKFRIKSVCGIDDVGMMREILQRRFQNDWPMPDLIFVDGGKGHLNMAQNVVAQFGHDIPVIGIAKGPTRKKVDVYYGKEALVFQNIVSDKNLIERIRDEAHRFAINYHKKLRKREWKG